MKPIFPLILLIALLVRCGEDGPARIATLTVEQGDFEISIKADGQLRAVKSTPINAPAQMQGSQVLVWLAEEGTRVSQGDVIVRFDEESVLLREKDTRNELNTLGYQSQISGRSNGQEGSRLETDLFLVDEEKRQAETFAPRDERLYSRHDIIDAEVNLSFLDTKKEHYVAKKERHIKSSETDRQIFELKEKGYQIQLDQIGNQKSTLAINAPHDGFLYYMANWRGDVPQIGQAVWPGMAIAELPDLNEMKAVVQVLETLAGGIRPGLKARVELDSRPGHGYEAEVTTVAALAKPVVRDSPVKYFEVTLSLQDTDAEFMRPNSSVTALIYIEKQENVIAVPSQVIFREDEGHYVYVESGAGFERRSVTLGKRSPTRTVVLAGLKAGDRLALSDPEAETKP